MVLQQPENVHCHIMMLMSGIGYGSSHSLLICGIEEHLARDAK